MMPALRGHADRAGAAGARRSRELRTVPPEEYAAAEAFFG